MRYELYARNPKAVRYGTEAVSFLCPKIWALVPQNIKDFSSFPCFKKNIGKWKTNYPCRLCKMFLKMLVLYSSTAVLPSQCLIYLKFISPVHAHVTKHVLHIVCITCSCSYYKLSARTIVTIYLEICF